MRIKFGKVTMLINNAGILFGNSILDSKPEDIEQTMAVNAMSHFWVSETCQGIHNDTIDQITQTGCFGESI